jgi:hypothetical protein
MEAARGQFVDGAWCDDEAGRDHGWQGPWLGGTMRSHTSSGVALRGHQEEQNACYVVVFGWLWGFAPRSSRNTMIIRTADKMNRHVRGISVKLLRF